MFYGGASELEATLEYDLSVEKGFCYKGLTMTQIIEHLSSPNPTPRLASLELQKMHGIFAMLWFGQTIMI